MVDYYIYAKDFSYSTERNDFYHMNGMESFEEFKSNVERIKNEVSTAGDSPVESKIIYLHWGDECYEVDEDTTVQTYKQKKGGSRSTRPETIIEWIQKHYDICSENSRIKLLYIITDGMITGHIDNCFELNENIQYERVVFHAFNENLNEIDLSVAAAFFKNRCIVYRNYELLDNVNISEDFDYDKITIDNFSAEKDNLKSYIKLKFIKKFKQNAQALNEIDQLKKLRYRLFDELSSKSEPSKINLETKDKNVFLQEFIKTNWYKSLNALEQNAKVDIEKFISTLINYIVSENKSYQFDALKFVSNFRHDIEEEPVVDVDFAAEEEIEFPDIILDDDKGIPVVILTEFNLLDKIIFHKTKEANQVSPASFSKFKSATECPLFLMNDIDVSDSIGYFYTLNVYKQLLEKTKKTEPRTRKQFHGGLVLTDTDMFDKYNDYVLSATYFNSKKVHFNVGLFYFVLWKNCENKEWMDKNVVEQFKKYVMRRISTTVCKIGLSSLPLDPQENVSLPTALWYCVELSSCIFKGHPQNFMHERLRMFYSVAQWMVEILKHFNYNLDMSSFVKRKELIRYVMILKRIQPDKDKVYYLLEKIFKKDNGFLISEFEQPRNLYILNYLKLNHKLMLPDDIVEQKVNLNNYVHFLNYVGDMTKSKDGEVTVSICEKTFRPFFTINKSKSFYSELLQNSKKIVINNPDDKNRINITYEALKSLEFDKVLSLNNLFIRYVKDSQKYPTLSEYIVYILQKKKFNGDLVTIFAPNVYFDIRNIYSLYQSIMDKVSVHEFLRVTQIYANRTNRIKAEEVVNFKDDSEICEFISNEELKVNLNKMT